MSRVEAIESEIKQLSQAEFAELREWMLRRDSAVWDREIESDAASGRLDEIFKQAVAEHEAGNTREL
jgi:hypothetical protein